jgi:hypothetical protein
VNNDTHLLEVLQNNRQKYDAVIKGKEGLTQTEVNQL